MTAVFLIFPPQDYKRFTNFYLVISMTGQAVTVLSILKKQSDYWVAEVFGILIAPILNVIFLLHFIRLITFIGTLAPVRNLCLH